MATEDCKKIPTESPEIDIENASDKTATEESNQNETTDSSQKPQTEKELPTANDDKNDTTFSKNLIYSKISSIINESATLASCKSPRERLLKIVQKVRKPPLPEGKKSYGNIMESVPLDKVESFMLHSQNYEEVLRRFDKTYRLYKYIGYRLDMNRRNLLGQIPELHRSVEEVAALRNDSLDELERQFLISDHVYVKTAVPKTKSVYLWLGGIIMLEYKLDEAAELLTNQLVLAISQLKVIEHDLSFLRQQIANCIENWTQVYNWVIANMPEENIYEEPQEGVEEDYNDEDDTEDPYTEECFPDEPYTEDGFTDAEAGEYSEVYSKMYTDGDANDNDKSTEEIKKPTAAEVELVERSEVVIEIAEEESADEDADAEVEKTKVESDAEMKMETATKEVEAAQNETVKSDADKTAVTPTKSSSSL